MAFVFKLPEVGEGVVEAEVVAWHVQVGDAVTENQPLCEITTDKAQLEISSPKAGRVLKLHGNPGDLIKVHSPLVELELGDGPAAAEGPISNGKGAAPPPAKEKPDATQTQAPAPPPNHAPPPQHAPPP